MLFERIAKTDCIQIEEHVCLYAVDEELDTIVQDMYGVDYILVHDVGTSSTQKYWRRYTSTSFTDDEIAQDTMMPLTCIIEAHTIAKHSQTTKKKSVTKETCIETKPPMQQSGYIKFMSQQLKIINQTHPSLSNKEKMTIVAKMWQDRK